MKKTMVMLIVAGGVISAASADLTFRWSGGTLHGSGVISGQSTILTFISDDAVIDFDMDSAPQLAYGDDVLLFATPTESISFPTVAPLPPGSFQTPYMAIFGPASGKYLYAVAVDMEYAGFTHWLNVPSDGSVYFGVGQMSPQLFDTNINQDFNPGDIFMDNKVVPEPATIGLMGIAGMGLYMARRKSHH